MECKPQPVCGGWGRWHVLILGQNCRTGCAACKYNILRIYNYVCLTRVLDSFSVGCLLGFARKTKCGFESWKYTKNFMTYQSCCIYVQHTNFVTSLIQSNCIHRKSCSDLFGRQLLWLLCIGCARNGDAWEITLNLPKVTLNVFYII